MQEIYAICITILCLGILVYSIVSRICATVYAIKTETSSRKYNGMKIAIKSDKDLQHLLKQLEQDFEKFEEE